MSKVFLFLFLSNIAMAAIDDFETVCLKKPVSKDFEILVQNNLYKNEDSKVTRDAAACKRLAKAALELRHVSFLKPIDDLSLLRFFPKADTIWLILTKNNKNLNVGEHPDLVSIHLSGDIAMNNIDSVSTFPKLASISVIARKESDSFIDVKGLSDAKQIRKLLLAGVAVRNAKEIEKLKDLEFVDIRKGAKLDTKIDWKLFPSLKSLTLD